MADGRTVRAFYRKLLACYPREFRQQLGQSMDQTFHDLWNAQRHAGRGSFRFVLWAFLDTIGGVLRARLLLFSRGGSMKAISRSIGLPALLSLLLIVPLMIMEVVNRRQFHEEFPTVLFFAMWLNLFGFTVILLPIALSRWPRNQGAAAVVSARGDTLLTRPGTTAAIAIALILSPGVLPVLGSLGLLSLDRLFNGPNPEVAYLPGAILTVAIVLLPIAAGVIAARPIARTLGAGGGVLAHPINVIIVAFLLATFAYGLATLVTDQWPCFIGVPGCD
jgi:hypothetical protein